MNETLAKIADNLTWFKHHPKTDVRRLALKNLKELTESMPQNDLTKEMLTKLEAMKYDGFDQIKWLRCRELKDRLTVLANPELYP